MPLLHPLRELLDYLTPYVGLVPGAPLVPSGGGPLLGSVPEALFSPASVTEGVEELTALDEVFWVQTIAGGTFMVAAAGSPLYPGAATLPGAYPGTFATGLFPAFYPSTQTIDTTDAPRLHEQAEGSLALTPLAEV